MKAESKPISLRSVAKAMLAVLLVSSVLFGSLLSVDHHLHRSIHADADHAEHQCLAVLLSQGLLEMTGLAAVIVAFVSMVAAHPLPGPTNFIPSPPYRLLPGRAPPSTLA